MNNPTVKLVQVTDCHLQNDPSQLYRNQDVESQLDQMLAHLKSILPEETLLLLTGDIVHHGGPDAYRRLTAKLASVPFDTAWIPGNHDDAALMLACGERLNRKVIQVSGWCLILLDSTSEPDGRGSGALGQAELAFLTQVLDQNSDRHCLIVLHHNPVSVESGWQDPIMLADADQFWRVLEPYSQVRGIICGHVHQEWRWQHQGVDVMSCPASSVQFKKRCAEMTLEDVPALQAPAYRLLELSEGGEINSQVKRFNLAEDQNISSV